MLLRKRFTLVMHAFGKKKPFQLVEQINVKSKKT